MVLMALFWRASSAGGLGIAALTRRYGPGTIAQMKATR